MEGSLDSMRSTMQKEPVYADRYGAAINDFSRVARCVIETFGKSTVPLHDIF